MQRTATTTCTGNTQTSVVASSTNTVATTTSTCVETYQPEVYYQDWLLVSLFVIFLLSLPVFGMFMSLKTN